MKVKRITNELTLYKVIIVIISLLLIGLFRIFIFTDYNDLNQLVSSEKEVLQKIEIIQLPLVSKAQDKVTSLSGQLLRGSNLNDFLLSKGISREDAASVVYEIGPLVNLRSLKAGETFELEFINDDFMSLTMYKSKNTIIEIERNPMSDSGFRAIEKDRKLHTYVKQVSGTIEGSLYNSALDAGISNNILMDLIMLLSFDVDFQRDIQAGDTFNVSFETIYDDEGLKVDDGQILCAQLNTDGREIEFYYYKDLAGKADYFNKEGQTIRKTLLKTPINGAYITSAYGMRKSPITGFSKKHHGIDFGAPKGTPIYASGDGVVESAYYSNVYGNFIQLRHVNGYRTLYAHMTNYASSIRKGRRVKQGQVIGYVGSTGMSTGPHLHYEISYWGTKVNPRTVKMPPGRSLEGMDLELFVNLKKSYIASFL